jgi:hypothetical protein
LLHEIGIIYWKSCGKMVISGNSHNFCRNEQEPVRISNKPWGLRGRDCMVIRFTTTCAISAYYHWSSDLEFRSWRGVLYTTLCVKVCQWLATGLSFSPVSSTNKTDSYDITEILLNTINLINTSAWNSLMLINTVQNYLTTCNFQAIAISILKLPNIEKKTLSCTRENDQ